MVAKERKQNKKKRRKKERPASYHHLVVPDGTDGINVNVNVNVNDNCNAHVEVKEEHAVAAAELMEEGSTTEIDGNVTSLEGRPLLHCPSPVNSKRKESEAYESEHHEKWNRRFILWSIKE
jgi:hypothetical protein